MFPVPKYNLIKYPTNFIAGRKVEIAESNAITPLSLNINEIELKA